MEIPGIPYTPRDHWKEIQKQCSSLTPKFPPHVIEYLKDCADKLLAIDSPGKEGPKLVMQALGLSGKEGIRKLTKEQFEVLDRDDKIALRMEELNTPGSTVNKNQKKVADEIFRHTETVRRACREHRRFISEEQELQREAEKK